MPTEAQESHPGRWQRSCQTSTWQHHTPLIATRGAVLLPLHRHMQWPHHCLPYLSKLTLQLKTAVIPQYFQHECTFSLHFPNFSVCFSRSDFTSLSNLVPQFSKRVNYTTVLSILYKPCLPLPSQTLLKLGTTLLYLAHPNPCYSGRPVYVYLLLGHLPWLCLCRSAEAPTQDPWCSASTCCLTQSGQSRSLSAM